MRCRPVRLVLVLGVALLVSCKGAGHPNVVPRAATRAGPTASTTGAIAACVRAQAQAKAETIAHLQRQLAAVGASDTSGIRQLDLNALSALRSGSAYVPVAGDLCLATNLASSFVGRTEKDANAAAEKVRLTVRVVERDDRSLPASANYVSTRVDLSISNGIVKTAWAG